MITKNSKDLFFTDDGDLFFDESKGDFHKAGVENNEILESLILMRLNSSSRDWGSSIGAHASLNDFTGIKVQESLFELIRERIIESLTKDGFLKRDEIALEGTGLTSNTIVLVLNIFKSFENKTSSFRLFYNSRNNKIKAFNYKITD